MFDPPFYFEPTLTIRDSYIAGWMSGLSSWKAEGPAAVTHLASARRQNKGTAFRDIFMRALQALFWFICAVPPACGNRTKKGEQT